MATLYNNCKIDLLKGLLDLFTASNLKVALCTSSYTPALTHHYFSEITNEVANGNGYASGGAVLANVTIALGAGGLANTAVLKADPNVWSNSTITARYAIIYRCRGGASSADNLVAYVDFGSDKVSSTGTFTLTWDATNGVLNLA